MAAPRRPEDKIGKGLGGTGSRSPHSIRAALERLPGVQRAVVYYNKSLAEEVVSTRTIPANGVGIWIFPSDLTNETRTSALSLLYAMEGGNVNRSLPSATGADGVRGTILGADNRPHYEGFWYMVTVPVAVDVAISPSTGYEGGGSLSSVTEPIREVVRTYFASLGPGDAVRQQDLLGLIAAVDGVARTTVTLSEDGGPYSSADIVVDPATFAALDTTADIVVHE